MHLLELSKILNFLGVEELSISLAFLDDVGDQHMDILVCGVIFLCVNILPIFMIGVLSVSVFALDDYFVLTFLCSLNYIHNEYYYIIKKMVLGKQHN